MKVVGMIPVFNEKDMISEVFDHLLSEGIELVVLDNGSTDGSYEICKKNAKKENYLEESIHVNGTAAKKIIHILQKL